MSEDYMITYCFPGPVPCSLLTLNPCGAGWGMSEEEIEFSLFGFIFCHYFLFANCSALSFMGFFDFWCIYKTSS